MNRITGAIGTVIAAVAMLVHNVTAGLHADQPMTPPAIHAYLPSNDDAGSEEIRRYFIQQHRPVAGLIGSNTVYLAGTAAGTSRAFGRLSVDRDKPDLF